MNQQNKTYIVLGIMSGTSLDGVDLCLTEFKQVEKEWKYSIIKAETIPYSNRWKKELKNAETFSGKNLIKLHSEYGEFLGKLAKEFLAHNNLSVDFISSHGHTIFHQIENKFTFQLGSGASLAATSGISTVSDFRSLDVALGGQGAPLVPFGDKFLFSEFDCCVNIGGISNLSFDQNGERMAFDVAPANMVLNFIMQQEFGQEYDHDGNKSRSGEFNIELFDKLNKVEFYRNSGPKSLGKEWVFNTIMPLLNSSHTSAENQLHTFTKHSAFQLAESLKRVQISSNVLITGGGAKNTFLIESLEGYGIKPVIPPDETIDFKEALIFAFLGLKRFLGTTNTLKSVTGASRDSCGGIIFLT